MAAQVDQRQQTLPLPPQAAPTPAPSLWDALKLGCFLLVRFSAWLAANIIGGLGMVVLLLLAISGGSMEGFFTHLDNLASRYLAADQGRRLAFDQQLLWIALLSALVILLIRLPTFALRLRREIRETSR